MKPKYWMIIVLLICGTFVFSSAYSTPSIQIVMEQTTFKYCEKLHYTLKVSEVTGEPAILHIRDETGKTSSAIPVSITNLENPIPSLVPFEEDIFPIGKYFVDIEYAGSKDSAEFNLIKSDNVCIPGWIKQLTYYWVSGQISDKSYSDGIKFLIQKDIIKIPKTVTELDNQETHIPIWIKTNAMWFIEEKISDNEFAQALQYLIKSGIIVV